MAGRPPYDDDESDSDDPDLLRALEESWSVTMTSNDVPRVAKYDTSKLEFGGSQQKRPETIKDRHAYMMHIWSVMIYMYIHSIYNDYIYYYYTTFFVDFSFFDF